MSLDDDMFVFTSTKCLKADISKQKQKMLHFDENV